MGKKTKKRSKRGPSEDALRIADETAKYLDSHPNDYNNLIMNARRRRESGVSASTEPDHKNLIKGARAHARESAADFLRALELFKKQ